MATTADFHNGLCIELNNDLYIIISFQHVKPGKGGAFVRTKLKGVINKKVVEKTFNAGVKITIIPLQHRSCQYLYKDLNCFYFMASSSYETIPISKEKISNTSFLKEGALLALLFRGDSDEVVAGELPPVVALEIKETELGVKGNTTSQAYKSAILETGAKVQVPLFINEGDVVKIDTATGTYLGRQKETS